MKIMMKMWITTVANVDDQGCRGQRNSYGDGQYQEELLCDDLEQNKRYH